MEPSEDNCRDAIKFISGFRAEGNTSTLMALKVGKILDADCNVVLGYSQCRAQ